MDLISFIYQSAFDFGAIFVAVSCIAYTRIHSNMVKPQTRVYLSMLYILIVTSVCDMLSSYMAPLSIHSHGARIIMFASDYIYFIMHNMMSFFMCYYTFFATQTFTKMRRKVQYAFTIPFAISEFLVITNPILHLSWYYDDMFRFQRGTGEYSIYISGLIYYLIGFYYLFFRWYAITRKRRIMITIAFAITAIGAIVQFFIPKFDIELFFETITLMGIMLSVEYDDDRVDMVTKTYNRDAFIQDLTYFYDTNTHFYAVLLKITNFETYQKMPDAYDADELVSNIADGLRQIFPLFTIYRVTPSSFVIAVLNKDEEYADELSLRVKEMLDSGLNFEKKDDRIKGAVMLAEAPEEIVSVRDMLLMCEMEFKKIHQDKVMKRGDLKEFFDMAGIERAIREGINEHNFEVFYQLVYTTKGHKIHSAEALVRLKDPKLSELLPKAFIPAAERNGMIDVIGEFVLHEVCRFIKSGVPDRLGMKYININLSVLQCMQPHFVERIKKIVNDEGVEPSRINLEITESIAAVDYEYLASVMRECKELGFLFSMEGYGSGYSNMNAVFSLDFDEIKLDKTMLWESEKSEYGRIILENSIRMIHDMKRPVVAVGVESREHIEKLEKLDVEYLQGFYFSRPESVNVIENMKQNG